MRGINDAKPRTPSNTFVLRVKPKAPESSPVEPESPLVSESDEVEFVQLILLASLVNVTSAH